MSECSSALLVPLVGTAETRGHGRPKIEIEEEQLRPLLDLGFSVPKIANLCGVSIKKVND